MENINDIMPLSNDWNKERLATLKNLFPDLFTNEGALNVSIVLNQYMHISVGSKLSLSANLSSNTSEPIRYIT